MNRPYLRPADRHSQLVDAPVGSQRQRRQRCRHHDIFRCWPRFITVDHHRRDVLAGKLRHSAIRVDVIQLDRSHRRRHVVRVHSGAHRPVLLHSVRRFYGGFLHLVAGFVSETRHLQVKEGANGLKHDCTYCCGNGSAYDLECI